MQWLQPQDSMFMPAEVRDNTRPADTLQTFSGSPNVRDIAEMSMQNVVKVQTIVISFKELTATFLK